jgi:hypothetical protein
MDNRQFSALELEQINKADDLKISPLRADGVTYGTPTWIWEVVINSELYVRAYNGINSRWYQSAISQKVGRIHAAGMSKDVVFEKVSGNINTLIDEAYKAKYNKSPYLSPMISDRAIAATIRIMPKQA